MKFIISEEEKERILNLYEQKTQSGTDVLLDVWNKTMSNKIGRSNVVKWMNGELKKNPFFTNKPIIVPGSPFSWNGAGRWVTAKINLTYLNSKINSISTSQIDLTSNFNLKIDYDSNINKNLSQATKDVVNYYLDHMNEQSWWEMAKKAGIESLEKEKEKYISGVQTVYASLRVTSNYFVERTNGEYILNIIPKTLSLSSSKLLIPGTQANIYVLNNTIIAEIGTLAGMKFPNLEIGTISDFYPISSVMKAYKFKIPDAQLNIKL